MTSILTHWSSVLWYCIGCINFVSIIKGNIVNHNDTNSSELQKGQFVKAESNPSGNSN